MANHRRPVFRQEMNGDPSKLEARESQRLAGCRALLYQGNSMKSLIPCLLAVVVWLSAVPARLAKQEKTPPEIELLAKELVGKLGNPKYLEREAASRELANLGLDARQAIEQGCKNPDPEIAARCESLIPLLRTLDLQRRIEEFAADQEGHFENALPLGVTYEKICGNDESARKCFVALCRNHLRMLDEAASKPE